MNDLARDADAYGRGHAIVRGAEDRPAGGGAGYPPDSTEGFNLDLRLLWSILYRSRRLIVLIVAAALAVGVAITLLTRPIYQATASIQIEQQSARVLETQDVEPTVGSQDADRFLQTQLDILRSRTIAERVTDSLRLAANDRFLVAMGGPAPDPDAAAVAPADRRRAVVATLRNALIVELPRDSRVASISFRSPDPALAVRVANSFAQNFILGNLKRKYDASSYARTFLEGQLASAKQRLEQSERATIAYARSARLIDASSGANADNQTGPRSLVTSSLIQLNGSLSQALSERVAAQQRWEQAQATPLLSLPEVQANAAVQDLIRQRAELTAAYQEQRERRKEAFPAMQQAQARITELDTQIRALATNVRNSLRDRYLVAAKQENALSANLGRLQGETLAEQDRSVRYNILRREVDTNRTLYDGLLQRYKEVSAASGVATNNVTIVDAATVPDRPIYPRPLINILLALLAGVALSAIVVFLRENFDDAIRLPDDVDRKLGIPFLGSIPKLAAGVDPQATLRDVRSGFAEAYYALRSSLEFATNHGAPRSLLCTSSVPSEGKSTTTAALAHSFARVGRSVLLIDGDLRKPSLHRVLGVSNTRGLSNLLTNQLPFEAVVQRGETDNLDLIPCGPTPPNPGELLAGPALASILREMTTRYDIVLIDGPPVMGLSDSPLISALVEGTVFVIEANRAHGGQAKIALRRLRAARANILGATLTKFDAREIGYGQNYGYNYSYGTVETPAPTDTFKPGR